MKFRYFLPWLMLSFLVFAEETLLVTQTQGDISFISGGVGGDERDAMQAISKNYNLNLLFSLDGSGEYLSDVQVRIKDTAGNSLLDTVADGPMFFAKLKPGRYDLNVEQSGHSIEKTIVIDGKQRARLSLSWPQTNNH
jgi:hypothetical protein